MVRFELTTLCLQGRCNNHYATLAINYYCKHTFISQYGARTRDHKIKSLALYHLS
jgi:hypothetical protein